MPWSSGFAEDVLEFELFDEPPPFSEDLQADPMAISSSAVTKIPFAEKDMMFLSQVLSANRTQTPELYLEIYVEAALQKRAVLAKLNTIRNRRREAWSSAGISDPRNHAKQHHFV